ncbi:nucleotidyltransferase [Dissulfurispira thermophila]|uniref:Nucleotidyltransferase n=2 Tax=root TaxID=1 RepID=A0A7G1H3B6_9BACT|nr:nucleotidyltransferase domain-containing protein [Dissulfurispira thermophila]BCB96217.1 nucleotidyltransferase [Dissulfurispira thermophila]
MNKGEIIRILREFLEKRQEIIFAYIYGSFAEGLSFRDIDVAVFVDEKAVTKEDALDYGLEISAITEVETGISPLDIRVINYAPVGLKYFATKGILLFSKDDDIRCDFLEESWKRYFDLLPKRRQILLDLVSP